MIITSPTVFLIKYAEKTKVLPSLFTGSQVSLCKKLKGSFELAHGFFLFIFELSFTEVNNGLSLFLSTKLPMRKYLIHGTVLYCKTVDAITNNRVNNEASVKNIFFFILNSHTHIK